MSEHRDGGGQIRKLWPTEWNKFRDHLLRLDKASRHLRFAHGVSDSFIEEYSHHMSEMGAIAYAYFVDGEVRGVAELKKLGGVWGNEAEAAFSIESAYQDMGIGTELMGRVIRAARNRGVQHLYMSCLTENTRMLAIARKFDADLRFEYDEVISDIVPEEANYFTIMAEAVEDRMGMMMAVLDLHKRIVQAA